jgi:hypothetical protein
MNDYSYFDGYHFFVVNKAELEDEVKRYNQLGFTVVRTAPTGDESKVGLVARKTLTKGQGI